MELREVVSFDGWRWRRDNERHHDLRSVVSADHDPIVAARTDFDYIPSAPTTSPTPSVDVIAPADLPGGSRLWIEHEGREMMVALPMESNAERGQVVPAIPLDPAPTRRRKRGQGMPTNGTWRATLWDWPSWSSSRRACHASCCVSCLCPVLALGQVMSRMQLNPVARPQHESSMHGERPAPSSWPVFWTIVYISVTWAMLEYALWGTTQPYFAYYLYQDAYGNTRNRQNNGLPIPTWVIACRDLMPALAVFYIVYVLFLAYQTRRYIQHYSGINNESSTPASALNWCSCCPNVWITLFCLPCSLHQMLRHTADYEVYRSLWYTETGLHERAPPTIIDPDAAAVTWSPSLTHSPLNSMSSQGDGASREGPC